MAYTSRPPASRKGARIAWDVLSARAARLCPPRTVVVLWHAHSLRPYPWQADLCGTADPDHLELDELELRDRLNNQHKYEDDAADAR